MTTTAVALDKTRPMISSSIMRMREQDRRRLQRQNQGTSVNSLKTSAIFNNRYEIVRTLSEVGGMSKMFVAFDPVNMREVILKTTDNPILDKFFQAETEVLEQDLNAMFPTHIESGRCGNVSFIAMEKIDGLTLQALIQRAEPIPLHQAIEITMSVLFGLNSLHQQGERVHRDIKPANIMLEHNGTPRLIDFGLAVAQDHQETAGLMVGTPTYLSPEQARIMPIRNNSDIYSLGLVLFEMMTSYRPVSSSNPLDHVHFHLNEKRTVPLIEQEVVAQRVQADHQESLSSQIEQAHEQLNNIIQGMTAKNPEVRFQEVDEVIAQLETLRTIAQELKPFETSSQGKV